jgi:uncharacterized phage protein (predicted DNA packaging)
MLEMDKIKLYLRINGTAEDELLERLKGTAIADLRGAVDDFDTRLAKSQAANTHGFADRAEMCCLAIISELYEHRVAPDKQQDYSYTIRSLITQLQCDTEFDTTETTS